VSTIDDEPTAALLDGRYRLEECVGRGGTAVVYRAEDTALGRTVAIKLLRQPDEMPSSLGRAHAESAALATMNHPALVTLYDARLDPGHPQYLAMEYVHGPTLATRLARGPLPVAEVVGLAGDIAAGLQTVHEAGIVHRDVKPSNILMSASTRPDREWTAKLTDFGIAFGMDDPRLTSPGIAVGTAAYMAPEQVNNAELTPAVDVYSLGLVLIEALTGEPAFPVTGGVQTALRRLTGPPTLPASLDAGWRDLLERMTRTEPGERPSAHEVADAVAALGPATTREYPVADVAGAASGLRRRRIAAAGAAAVLASILALAGLHGISSSTADTPQQKVTREQATTAPTQPATESPRPTAPATPSSTHAPTVPGATTASTDGGTTRDATSKSPASSSNPNRGPGNNSGSTEHPPKGKEK